MPLSTATVRLYRTLIDALGGDGVKALNEPSHAECGAPDFIVEHSGVTDLVTSSARTWAPTWMPRRKASSSSATAGACLT